MKLAAYWWGGKRQRRPSVRGRQRGDAARRRRRGAGARRAGGDRPAGARQEHAAQCRRAAAAVGGEARCAIPGPRRNIFCVGKNYREHAKESPASGFDTSAPRRPMRYPTFPSSFLRCPIASWRRRRSRCRRRLRGDRLRGRARRGDRQRGGAASVRRGPWSTCGATPS